MSFGDLERGYNLERDRGFKGYQSTASPSSSGRGGDEEYIRLSQQVTGAIQQISMNVNSLQKLTGQLGTPKDTEEMREKLTGLLEKTKDLSEDAARDLKLLGKLDGGTPIDAQQRKLQQGKLTKDLEDVLKKYSEISRISMQKQREYIALAKKRTESMRIEAATKESSGTGQESKGMLVEEQRRQQVMALENEIEFNEALIAEREEGIKDIETNIAVVNEIFRDLSLMVKEQGETLDTIEGNISQVVDHTDGATTELKGANKYQKSARNKMCCLLVTGIVVLAALILIIVFNVI